jgi:hypothetical protein
MDDFKIQELNGNEHLMVRLAVACGSLEGLNKMEEGPSHSRKKRMLRDLREILVTKVGLPRVTQKNMGLFGHYITASEATIVEIIKKADRPEHILLNLIRYCLVDQPMKDTHRSKIDHFFGMWDGAYMYPDLQETGDSLFKEIETEARRKSIQSNGVLV